MNLGLFWTNNPRDTRIKNERNLQFLLAQSVITDYVSPMPSINENFAAEMRAQLARKQLTSRDLADELHLSYSSASRLLNGKAKWSLDTATRAALFAGLTLSEVFGEVAA